MLGAQTLWIIKAVRQALKCSCLSYFKRATSQLMCLDMDFYIKFM